jgi:hypothetical protein
MFSLSSSSEYDKHRTLRVSLETQILLGLKEIEDLILSGFEFQNIPKSECDIKHYKHMDPVAVNSLS